ncbi:MAG TPA: hypothetical protein VMT27_01660, partial [Actinomycetes bacterium]|nr:hypothetical protein [Actinomycetes bacterium]
RIGQPEDYGTEFQGRKLGEARSLAGEGLTDDAVTALEQAAAGAPEGSNDKRLIQEAADALRGLPEGDTGPLTPEAAPAGGETGAPEAAGGTAARAALTNVSRPLLEDMLDALVKNDPGDTGDIARKWLAGDDLTGEEIRVLAHEAEAERDSRPADANAWDGLIEDLYSAAGDADDDARAPAGGTREAAGGGPEVAQVENALVSVESAIEGARLAEGDNGPQGWTDTLDEANRQLGLIQGKVTAEGPYTQLSEDLRELADFMEGNWQMTDSAPIVEELRNAADGLDGGEAGGGAGPKAPAPSASPESASPPGSEPGRLDAADVAGLTEAFSDQKNLDKIADTITAYQGDEGNKYRALLEQVQAGSLANAELNQAWRENKSLVNGAYSTWGDMDTAHNGSGVTPEKVESSLRMMGGDEQDILDIMAGQGKPAFDTDSINEFMAKRISDSAARAKADADEITADENFPFDLRHIRSQLEMGSTQSALRRENGRVSDLAEYEQLVTETTAILQALSALRDPDSRVGLRLEQQVDLARMARRVSENTGQADRFFNSLMDQGINPAPFEQVLREQLGKFGVEDMLNPEELTRDAAWQAADNAFAAYQAERRAGKPGTEKGVEMLGAMRTMLHGTNATPNRHGELSHPVQRLVDDQLPLNGGVLPDAMREILSDPVFSKYGQFNSILARMDMEDMIREGEPNDLYTATDGRYRIVDWETPGVLAPELTQDDRSEDDVATIADDYYNETVGTLTPNVASALTSLFTSIGGGIHRTSDNITQANVPEAEYWRGLTQDESWRSTKGSDTRAPTDVGGVYMGGSNTLIISDKSVLKGDYSPVVTHELGHAMDSMLGELTGSSDWFSKRDAKFAELHATIKDTAFYGDSEDDANDSILYWYFRNSDEGSTNHNDSSGTTEMFAQGLSVYSSATAELEKRKAEGASTEAVFWKMGNEFTAGAEERALAEGGLHYREIRERTRKIGEAIFEYYDDLEKNRLPQLMSTPRVVPTRSRPMEYSVTHGDIPVNGPPQKRRATRTQLAKLDTVNNRHHGLIQLKEVQRGTPEWDAMEAAITQHSPGTQMPSADALKVTWNPSFPEQGNTVIYKALMPRNLDKATIAYTDEHKTTQSAAKFNRVSMVRDAMEKIYNQVRAQAPFDVTSAAALALLNLGMRVGGGETTNKESGRKVTTFGATTMLKKHVFYPVGQDRAEEWLR